MLSSINKAKLLYEPEIIKINNNNYIKVSQYSYRNNTYYEVIFNNNGKDIFIGKYDTENQPVNAKYNDGKILVYTYDYVGENHNLEITKVLNLYDILDETFFCVTEEEALGIFDVDIDSSNLKNRDRIIKERNYRKVR